MSKFQSFLTPQIELFIHYRVVSEKWNAYDERMLKTFDRYCAENHSDATKLSQEMVDNWCQKRSTEQNNTCRARIRSVRSFITYLRARGETDVTLPVMPPIEETTFIPHAFTDDELSAFFKACDNMAIKEKTRNSHYRKIIVPVFFRLLYSSGIRTFEARLLRVADVDLQYGVLNIQKSKGLDQHYVALHDTMLELMRKYDAAIRKVYPNRMYFFPSSNQKHYKSCWLNKTFSELWKTASDSHATPYALRHNYATANINSWTDGGGFGFDDKLQYLSKSMGHRDFRSTQYYYSLVPQFADILVEKTNASFEEIVPEVFDEEID